MICDLVSLEEGRYSMKSTKWSKYVDIQDILNILLVICTLIALVFSLFLIFPAPNIISIACLFIPTFIVYAVQNAVMEYYIYHVDEYDLKALNLVLRN